MAREPRLKTTQADILAFMKQSNRGPFALRRLMAGMDIDVKDRREFKNLLEDLLEQGQLIRIKGGKYGLPRKMDLIPGYVKAHPSGYGFIIPDDVNQDDIFIPPDKMREVLDADRVMARLDHIDKDGRRSGSIIRILHRAHKIVTGRYEKSKYISFVTPNNPSLTQDIIIPKGEGLKPRAGQLVVVEILSYPTKYRNPTGKIIEILGWPDDPKLDVEIVLRDSQLPSDFPEEVQKEAQKFSGEIVIYGYDGEQEGFSEETGHYIKIAHDDVEKRLDLRNLLTFTIDGERARDFDDAVSLQTIPENKKRLWVHIADVSHYVKEDDALDKEAFIRGTSIYFPDRAIPMLPTELSNDLCSLKAGVERLTISVSMDFDEEAKIMSYNITPSLIKSSERLTYTEVADILSQKEEIPAKYRYLQVTLEAMRDLAMKLREKRLGSGSLDFDLPEPEIILDLRGDVQSIIRAERNIAHMIIEEFMLAANQVIAKKHSKPEIPFIYRIHEPPEDIDLLNFLEFIHGLGWKKETLDDNASKGKKEGKKFHHKTKLELNHMDLQDIQEHFREKPEEGVVNFLLLRAMKQARYSTQNLGHFGLAMDHYTHFTSPIRRYPDLIVHRLLKKVLGGQAKNLSKDQDLAEKLAVTANHSSIRERMADDAERKIVDIKRTRYMEEKIGEEYIGVISNVTSFGFFVELEEVFVEGLVHLRCLGEDYYHFDERKHQLKGERTKRVFCIGDRVTVRVAHVDLQKLHIDFTLITKSD